MITSVVLEACRHLEFNEEIFGNSHKFYMGKAEFEPKIQEADKFTRYQYDMQKIKEITKSKEQILDTMKMQMKLSFESANGLDHLKQTLNKSHFIDVMSVERSKCDDVIFMKTGMTAPVIARHIEHFRLKGEPSLKLFSEALQREHQAFLQKKQESYMLSPPNAKELELLAKTITTEAVKYN